MARSLCRFSLRRDKPFVKVNCATLPTELLESELFGFERGAFTGAVKHNPGKFEFANRGTIFLDEIDGMSLGLQAKLLQDGEFSRLGGRHDVRVDVRIISATNRDLQKAVADDQFIRELEDLVKRAAVLRDEAALRNDVSHRVAMAAQRSIAPLAPLVAEPTAASTGSRAPSVAAAIAAAAADRGNYSLKDISRTAAREAERELILRMLQQTRWNRKETAKNLGIRYKALLYKIKRRRPRQGVITCRAIRSTKRAPSS